MWISPGGWGTVRNFRTLKSMSISGRQGPEGIKAVPTTLARGEKLYHNRKRRKRPGFGFLLRT